MTFVGTHQLEENGLKKLIKKLNTSKSYFFLRWVDQVELCESISEKLPPEGQLFNADLELRWKKNKGRYDVVLLSSKDNKEDFKPIKGKWKHQDHNAYIYPSTETRFPKGIHAGNINIGQRYFFDADTSIIHFVALTLKK